MAGLVENGKIKIDTIVYIRKNSETYCITKGTFDGN